MVNNFGDYQKFGQESVERAMRTFGGWNKGWQAIVAEAADYNKRTFEQGTATLEKLLTARSLEQALEIQASYARHAYGDYMQQMTKLGTMYAEMAKEAYKPVDEMTSRSR